MNQEQTTVGNEIAYLSTSEGMTGREKAAALLVALGSDACAKIFKDLSDDEVEQLAIEIIELQHVDPDTMVCIFQEFCEMASIKSGGVRGSIAYATDALRKAFGAESMQGAVERIRASTTMKSLDHLAATPGSIELLQQMMQDEHPQTIALILAHIKEQRAAEILSSLLPDLQVEVLTRIANMTTVSPEVISQIENTLRAKSQGNERVRAGGIRAAAEILNRIEPDMEKRIMESMADMDAELAQKISDLMFTYEDIIMITDAGMQRLLQEVDENDLLMALKASTDMIKAKVLKNMSERRRQAVQEDMESMPPVRLKDALTAQKKILEVAKELSQSGQIELIRDEGQEVYV